MNKYLLPIISFLALLLVFTQLHPGVFKTNAQTNAVTFGVIGDMGGNSNASAVLNTVKNANLNFFLHVGDFSYNQQGGPTGWPTWVKGIVGSVLPYEIVSGNHDDCCISSYVAGLPNKMANLNGTYGKNYYFDYPQTSPLMRVIMISPGGFAPDTTWLNTAIDSARSSNIPWVIVGMHRNCITTGQKSCEIGSGLLTSLINKKVDIILQGHDHNYQRSKQLTCAQTNTYNASCVANAGPNYVKGAGTVILIDGAGGNGLYSVSSSDSEAGYFAKINSDTYGFAKFTVSATQISEQFVRGAGGSMSDAFTIAGSSTTNPSPTPTKPVTQPSPTGVVPTFGCVSNLPCTPSATPTTKPNTTPTTNPGISGTPSTQPTIDPCNAGASIADNEAAEHHRKHHKKGHRSGGNGFFSQLIQKLLEWLMKLLEQLGIQLPDGFPTPNPSSAPTAQPTSGSTNPTAEPTQTTNPCPSVTP